LAGRHAPEPGEQAEALAWGRPRSRSTRAGTLIRLAAVYLNAGRVADAKSVTAGLHEPGFLYLLAFLEDDAAEMARQRSAVTAGSFDEFDVRAREAQAAMAAGGSAKPGSSSGARRRSAFSSVCWS